jgi:FkbM family methyltransferase
MIIKLKLFLRIIKIKMHLFKKSALNKNNPPFDLYLENNLKKIILSLFKIRFPFALDRNYKINEIIKKRLFPYDENNRYGNEPELSHLLELLLLKDSVFLDIGSNRGYFSIFVADKNNFKGQCIAFEPSKKLYNQLINRIKQLKLSDLITCHNIGVSDRKQEAIMVYDNEETGSSFLTNDLNVKGEKVKLNTIDNMAIKKVSFMKIDVESYEKKVLQGAIKTIKRDLPFLFIETWKTEEDKNGDEFCNILGELDYVFFLPSWLQNDNTFHVGVGPSFEMEYFALVPFKKSERIFFPGNPINIFACHKNSVKKLGYKIY